MVGPVVDFGRVVGVTELVGICDGVGVAVLVLARGVVDVAKQLAEDRGWSLWLSHR